MASRIAVLSEELINKIAAGEVVERPGSVIKELCENAIDAQARTVRVTLREGGLFAITVQDDGFGMSREDALLCLSRHATSKLKDLEGLFQISTKGFRGEAIPAIASVSRFALTTSEPNATVGTRLRVEGGGPIELGDAPAAGGTLIEVEDLFFNTPARRKFMRRDQTELAHCEEAVIRLALAHPEVGFFLEHGGRSLFASPACEADPRERIAAALGVEIHPHLLEVDERRLGIRVRGYVASPEFTLPTARGIYAFVNQRYIRDRAVNHAIQRAFQESLPPGRQPVAVLFIELDPRAVDVNVHPQKMEVRFGDGRGVHDTVVGAITRALKSAPWLKPLEAQDASSGAHYALAVDRFLARAKGEGQLEPLAPLLAAEGQEGAAPAFGNARPGINEAPPPGYFGALRYLGTLGRRFFVCEGSGGTLVVVDPHAALERVRLTELRRALASPPTSQRFLFASRVELPLEPARVIAAHTTTLERLGVFLEPFGGTTFALSSVPPSLVGSDYQRLLIDLASALPPPGVEPSLGAAVQILACHAAGQVRRAMSEGEIQSLLAQLDQAEFHVPCAHPTVVLTELPLLELARRASWADPPEN